MTGRESHSRERLSDVGESLPRLAFRHLTDILQWLDQSPSPLRVK